MSMEPIAQIRTKFQTHKSELKQLFATSLNQSQFFDLEAKAFLDDLFSRVEDILQTEMTNFRRYIEKYENHSNITQLSFKHFEQLFRHWCQINSPVQKQMAESFMISEVESDEQGGWRNHIFKNILQIEKKAINRFLEGVKDRKRLDDVEVSQLLTMLFDKYYVYEKYDETMTMSRKHNFSSQLNNILRQFKKTLRPLKTFDHEDNMNLNEIPQILKLWETLEPQLTVQITARKAICRDQSTQVEQDETPTLTSKLRTSIRKSLLPKQQNGSIELTLNKAIKELYQHRTYVKDMDWLESIDYLLITLQKERRRLYPNYRKSEFGQNGHTLSLALERKYTQQPQIALSDEHLSSIYEHYRAMAIKKKEQQQDLNASFLGQYAQQAFRKEKQKTLLNKEYFKKFVQDLMKCEGISSSEYFTKKSSRNRFMNEMTYEQFKEQVKKLVEKNNKYSLSETAVVNFYKKQINPGYLSATAEVRSSDTKKLKMPIKIYDKVRKGSCDSPFTGNLFQPLGLYTGREQPLRRTKKGNNSPSVKASFSRSPNCPVSVISGIKKKETYGPYGPYRLTDNRYGDPESAGIRKKARGSPTKQYPS